MGHPRPFPAPAPALARITAALVLLAALLVPGWAMAQTFPALTGPVVDAANVIPDDVEVRIAQKLIAFKQQTGQQLQVATVPDLQGYEIGDYANPLFRTWQIGDKEKNDGALLLIAPNERKVRVEVGYGLEGTLTDAVSSQIIRREIVPRFKAGDMPGGIEAGTDALIKVLQLSPEEAAKVAAEASKAAQSQRSGGIDPGFVIWLVIFLFFFVIPMLRRARGGRRYHSSGLGPLIVWNTLDGISRGGGGWSGGGGGDWGGGSDWGGGGGSSGGGGASGSW